MKKLLSIFSVFGLIATPMSSVVACSSSDNYSKIRLDHFTNSSQLFLRLFAMVKPDIYSLADESLLPSDPDGIESFIRDAVSRVFETNALRLTESTMDSEIKIQTYDNCGNELALRDVVLKNPFKIKVSAVKGAKYFSSATEVLDVNGCEAFAPEDEDEKVSLIYEQTKWQYHDLTEVSGLTFAHNVTADELTKSIYYHNRSSLVKPIYLNDFQTTKKIKDVEGNQGMITITVNEDSDRYRYMVSSNDYGYGGLHDGADKQIQDEIQILFNYK